MPLISVVTSVHNGEAYLKECVDSVLNQTFQDFEYIILNNGSTDRTSEILEEYKDPRLRVVHQENLGIPKSLNKGASICSAELIAHLDADDYVYPQWLEKIYDFLSKNKDIVLCGSRFEELFNGKLYPQVYPFLEHDYEIRKSLCFVNPIPHSFTIIRKSPFFKVGVYDPNIITVHDYDLWIRLLGEGKGHTLNQILGVCRIHDSSASKKKERTMIKELFKIQWKAYTRLGGDFWKMARSLLRRGIALFLPFMVRSKIRASLRK